VLAIAITLLVLEVHVPTGNEALVKGLAHEWPRYLGYVVSFTFIGGVWIAHNYMTRFVTHLFPSFLPSPITRSPRTDLAAERVAVVIFGLNLTVAAFMLYVMIRHAGRTPDLPPTTRPRWNCGARQGTPDSGAASGGRRRVGLLLPVIAVIFYPAVSVIYLIEPFREVDIHAQRAARQGNPDPGLRPQAAGRAPGG
jgi:hypothetical protein